MNIKHCIDISDDQGTIDWNKVKACGFVDGVMIQATYGLHSIDANVMPYMMGCKSVGLPFGFYHYFYPRMDPEAQAEHFYAYVLSVAGGFKGQIAPWCDCEESDGYGADFVSSQTLAYMRTIAGKIGQRWSQLYTGLSFAESYLGNISGWGTVVADYGSNAPDPQAPVFTQRPIPQGWAMGNVVGWQYTSKHLVPGIPVAVDGDLLDFDEVIIP